MDLLKLGSRGDEVRKLQEQLNAQGANIAVDGIFGPQTQGAVKNFQKQSNITVDGIVGNQTRGAFGNASNPGNPDTSVVPDAPEGQVLGVFKDNSQANELAGLIDQREFRAPNLEGEDDQFLDQLAKNLRSQAMQTVDSDQITSEMIASRQQDIDAINAVYDQLLAEERQRGQGRQGQNIALTAARGLAGSARGQALSQNVLDVNRRAETAIENERNARIAAVLSGARDDARQEIQDRRIAQQQGADAYLDFLSSQTERRKDKVQRVVGALIDQEIDISELAPEELSEIARNIGTSEAELASAYNSQLSQIQAAQAEEQRAREQQEFDNSIKLEGVQLNRDKFTQDRLEFEARYGLDQAKLGLDRAKFASDQDYNFRKLELEREKLLGEASKGAISKDGRPTGKPDPIAATFASRMVEANKILDNVESTDKSKLTGLGSRNRTKEFKNNGKPISAGRQMRRDDDVQSYLQARRNFVNAVLRKESGAAIGEDEFRSASAQYFAMPGDTDEVLLQKQRNRVDAINGLIGAAGTAYDGVVLNKPSSYRGASYEDIFGASADSVIITPSGEEVDLSAFEQ